MSGVSINGVDLEVQMDALKIDTETIGETTRAADASLRDNIQAQLLKASGTTLIITMGEALFLRALLLRQRDAWRWSSDLFSDKGLGPSASSGTTVGGGAGGELELEASTGTVTYPRQNRGAGFTVAVAVDPDGSGFHDWIVAFDQAHSIAALYKDGVAQYPSLPSWITCGSLFFTLKSSTAHVHKFSDLEAIDAAIQPSQATGLAAFRAANVNYDGNDGLPRGPDLWVDGIWPAMMIMQGDVSESTTAAGVVGSGFASDNLPLAFSLRQVRPGA